MKGYFVMRPALDLIGLLRGSSWDMRSRDKSSTTTDCSAERSMFIFSSFLNIVGCPSGSNLSDSTLFSVPTSLYPPHIKMCSPTDDPKRIVIDKEDKIIKYTTCKIRPFFVHLWTYFPASFVVKFR